MSTMCSIVHENEGEPCKNPAQNGRPDCRYHLREISDGEKLAAGKDVHAELDDHKVDLRYALICARQGPMSHVSIGVVEDITRQYSTRIERDSLKILRSRFEEAGYDGVR